VNKLFLAYVKSLIHFLFLSMEKVYRVLIRWRKSLFGLYAYDL